jgi:uncharacterized membrane protein YraQ (UPF0718 family)
VTLAAALPDLGRAAQQSFFMFWETFWPLVLGFTASGAVQAFVSRGAIQRSLGTHRPAAVARASLFGMASSSCSYAAAAMSRSLFAKGADFVTANAFMIASTNLVVELGVVLVVLMGWQFAVGEYVGGVIMIGLLAGVGGLALRGRLVTNARQRVVGATAHSPAVDAHCAPDMPAPDTATHCHPLPQTGSSGSLPLRTRLLSAAGWADASRSSMSDIRMLRKELVIGYVAAGALAVLVPQHVWNDVFIAGHGGWSSLENALVGPLIALISCVCSIGNVPLAAALWHGGISFGGVVAFLFADLIALPLLLVYRNYYGTRVMLRMLAVFWALMSIAGYVTGQLFTLAGLVPHTRPAHVASTHLNWDATTVLNLVFGLVLFALWQMSRRQPRASVGVPVVPGAVTVPPSVPA